MFLRFYKVATICVCLSFQRFICVHYIYITLSVVFRNFYGLPSVEHQLVEYKWLLCVLECSFCCLYNVMYHHSLSQGISVVLFVYVTVVLVHTVSQRQVYVFLFVVHETICLMLGLFVVQIVSRYFVSQRFRKSHAGFILL